MRSLRVEVLRASPQEARAYLLGASRDGTFNRLHNTLRISQTDTRWLQILQVLFAKLGSRSWIYQEGERNVWVIETTCRLDQLAGPSSDLECAAFARGYFDAEGGVRFKLALTEEQPTIKPYDEGRWAALSDSLVGSIEPTLALFEELNARWVLLLGSMTPDQFARSFVHPDTGATVRLDGALSYYAWHFRHHTGQILWVRKQQSWDSR
jgi:hypothetical protein